MPVHRETTERRRPPAWLLGLAIAVVVTVAVLLLMAALGIGDDPVVQGLSHILD